jgi:hypothetical protein
LSGKVNLMRTISASLALAITLVSAPSAIADTDRAGDPDDIKGKLDIAAIHHGHGADVDTLTHRVTTHEGWKSRILGPGGKGELRLIFSTRKNACAEQAISIVRRKGRLIARIAFYDPLGCGPYDDSGGGSPYEKMNARVRRTDDRSVRLVFDRSELLPRWDDDYRWSAETRWQSERCSHRVCYDSGPDEAGGDRGILRHELR